MKWANRKSHIEDIFIDAVGRHDLETARTIWRTLQVIVDKESEKQILKRGVLFTAELGSLAFARELIDAAELWEELFPLDRALEYLQTQDAALLAKLSPDIREAVQVVVSDLQVSLQQSTESKAHPLARVRLAIDDDYIAKRWHLMHKLTGKDSTGRLAYYFVLVLDSMKPAFLRALRPQEYIVPGDYGRIIASCYGEGPDEHLKSFMKEKYGFSV